MKRKLIVKPRADLDMTGHYVYLLGCNPGVAERLRQEVKSAYKRIHKDPQSFAKLDLPGREAIELRFCHPHGLSNYSIIFQVTDDAVFVWRVLHASQDIDAALRS